jgi:hypothetical protein
VHSPHPHHAISWFLSLLVIVLSGCSVTTPSDITPEQAIELARHHVGFEPATTATRTGVQQGRAVWVVTFTRADGSHGGLGQFIEVTLDRKTGSLVALAMS